MYFDKYYSVVQVLDDAKMKLFQNETLLCLHAAHTKLSQIKWVDLLEDEGIVYLLKCLIISSFLGIFCLNSTQDCIHLCIFTL